MNEERVTKIPWWKLHHKLGRKTNSTTYIPQIDGLRAIVLIGVVLFHSHGIFLSSEQTIDSFDYFSSDWYHYLIARGWYGVQIFFILSGLFLSLPMAKQHLKEGKKLTLKHYYANRFLRISIPYYICLTLTFLYFVLDGQVDFFSSLPRYGAGLIYSHMFIYNDLNPLLYVSWTLEIEIQFYLIAPLLCLLFKISHKWFRRLVFLILIVLSHELPPVMAGFSPDVSYTHTLIGQSGYFLTGMLLADFYLNEIQVLKNKPNLICDLLGLSLWITIPALIGIETVARWMPIIAGCAIATLIGSKWIKWALSFLPQDKGNWHYNLLPLLLNSLLTIIACVLLYTLIEKPFMNFYNKFRSKQISD